ncbi:MAG: hypothetical protein HGA53_00555 [Anaerolineaceae bacterium]|jgi:hypothetical protein|nr:hypothetical protein [Anaerolineaceae bacterium]NTV35421.1 hypothetical protein [Anaerolineaceae bacterium]
MPRIRCHYLDCMFLDEGYCSAAQVELDPDSGCATYQPSAEEKTENEWEEEELEEWDELEDEEEGEEEIWLDDEEEEEEY